MQPNNNKAVTIVASAVILAAFFMPWISIFGASINAWSILFGDVGKLVDTPFKFVALLIPFSAAMIIYGAAFNEEKYPLTKQILFLLPILTLIVIALVIGAKIGDSGGSLRSSDLENLFKIFGIGFWLTLIASIVLPFLNQQQTVSTINIPQVQQNLAVESLHEVSTTSREPLTATNQTTIARPQININLPKVDWDKTFKTTKTFTDKHKVKLLIAAGCLIALILVYNLFLKADPVKDGKNLAKNYCLCAEELNKDNATTMQAFLNEFDSKNFKSRLEAKTSLLNLFQPNQTKYNNCTQQADIKYRERYADYNGKGGSNVYIFEQTYTSLISGCNSLSDNQTLSIQTSIDQKVQSIQDPEPDIEQIKRDLLNREIPGWRFAYLNEFESISIVQKFPAQDRLDFDLQLSLVDNEKKNKHEAGVYIVYNKSDEGWYLNEVNFKYITFDNLIAPDSWTQVAPLPNTRWTADNSYNLTWKTCEWCPEYQSGPSRPPMTLPSSNIYMIKAEDGQAVNVKFTYRQ